MIDPDWPKHITFSIGDVPELPEIPDFNLESEKEERRRRSDENARWLEEHFGWKPFSCEW